MLLRTNFDEDDDTLMNELGACIAKYVPLVFGSKLSITGPNAEDFNLSVSAVQFMSHTRIKSFLDLVDCNLSRFYIKNSGESWKRHKFHEMKENGLVYVWYSSNKDIIAAFASFKLCQDEANECKILYLYEIHVDPLYHNAKFGTTIMVGLQRLVPHLRLYAKEYIHFANLGGLILTVFSDNIRAVKWYESLGYVQNGYSPRDRKLQSGVVVKPSYYILNKMI